MADGQSIPFRGIYAIRNKLNGRIYIGSAVDFHARWNYHRCLLNLGTHKNRHLQSAWKKYGPDAFVFEILEAVRKKADLVPTEQRYLDDFRPWDHSIGYNNSPTAGSCLGVRQSAETRAKMSETKKNQSAETRARIAETLKGRKFSEEWYAKQSAAHKGYKHSPEARAKMSATRKGKKRGPLSAEHRAKIGAIHKGMKHTAEARAKMSAARTGRTPTPETLAKLSAAQSNRTPEHAAKVAASLVARNKSPEMRARTVERNRRKAAEQQEQVRAALAERFGGPPCPWVKDGPATKQLSMFED